MTETEEISVLNALWDTTLMPIRDGQFPEK
jgi:hypothetical protein